jgi:hypothetical protein
VAYWNLGQRWWLGSARENGGKGGSEWSGSSPRNAETRKCSEESREHIDLCAHKKAVGQQAGQRLGKQLEWNEVSRNERAQNWSETDSSYYRCLPQSTELVSPDDWAHSGQREQLLGTQGGQRRAHRAFQRCTFFFPSIGYWTQGLMLARQATWAMLTVLLLSVYNFPDRVWHFCLGLALDGNLILLPPPP